MNDDDLLFPVDDLERWKKRGVPGDWLTKQRDVMHARMRAQAAKLQKSKTVNSAASGQPLPQSPVLIASPKPEP